MASKLASYSQRLESQC